MMDSQALYIKNIKKNKIMVLISRIVIAVAVVLGWEVTTQVGLIDSFIFSSPSRIVKCFIELTQDGMIFRHMGITIAETLIAFLIVIVFAITIAILMWRFEIIFRVMEPYIVLLNSIPKSALAPLLIVWLGNNFKTIVVAAVSVAVLVPF